MLRDPINYLHLHFLSPVVSEFERVDAFFQATDIDSNEMMKELNLYYNILRGRVYNSSGVALPTDKAAHWAKFIYEATALIRNHNNDEHTEVDERSSSSILRK